MRLHYEERGSGYPLLLFAPGGMNSRASFWGGRPGQWIDPIVELSDEFRVIAMDQRNAGRSEGPVRVGDGWHTYVSDALALLDHLAIDDLAVMGGCIGVSYCLRLCADAPGAYGRPCCRTRSAGAATTTIILGRCSMPGPKR